MEELCPICSKPIPKLLLERHVNSCLDNQEVKPDTENTGDSTDLKAKKRDAFSALGLKVSTDVQVSKKKKSTQELKGDVQRLRNLEASSQKEPNNVENESTLTRNESQTQPFSNDATKEIAELKRQVGVPLAHRLRPKTLNDFIGQERLLGGCTIEKYHQIGSNPVIYIMGTTRMWQNYIRPNYSKINQL